VPRHLPQQLLRCRRGRQTSETEFIPGAVCNLLELLPIKRINAFITESITEIYGYFVPDGRLRVIPHICSHLATSAVRVSPIPNIYVSSALEISGILL